MSTPGYPDGYHDPEWTTPAEFGGKVIPARAEALTESLNASLGGALPDGVRFGWAPVSEDEPDSDGYAVVTTEQFEDFTMKHGIRWTPQ